MVEMLDSYVLREAFRPGKVLEIYDLQGHLIERNAYLCVKCFTLTGKTCRKPRQINDGRDATLKCGKCSHQWLVDCALFY